MSETERRRGPRPVRHGRAARGGAAAAALAALVGLAGCGTENVPGQTREVFPDVEIAYDEAIRHSVAEVPTGELTSLELRHADREPVWRSEVVADDGTLYVVRLSATTGRPLPPPETTPPPETPPPESPPPETTPPPETPSPESPPPETTPPPATLTPEPPPAPEGEASERTLTLLEEAKLLPEEAVRQVTKPEFGKVARIDLRRGEAGRVVWTVKVAAIRPENFHRYDVDAVTGEVLRRTPLPAPSG
ncbi:PepSY domain-containing protein [Streptomyces sp. JJ36]|uniref:PepSY domain-containing protein n=1 Tax=Streptomyces sp. JJ36 TaxID=2736645 RepID=UPI001F24A5F1|nr:hypothetical protein [Streptomyces sp. JJ36]MCF6525639.1 PepSY domain-containing protein [Streptomyces sp. JJ36]